MGRKRHTAEEIVAKLRQVDVLTARGHAVTDAVRTIDVTELNCVTSCSTGESFYTLNEARIVIEAWRRHYNTVRPDSSLGYRPPAPEVASWPTTGSASSNAQLIYIQPGTTQWGTVRLAMGGIGV